MSKNTVSLALRNDPQISEATRTRIQGIAREMGYQLNPIVSNLMAQLRSSRQSPTTATLALINANENEHAFEEHPTIPRYVSGCRKRSQHLGYSMDTFWLNDPDLDASRLHRILVSRGIRGAVIVGLMNSNRLPESYNLIWNSFPCIVTGVRTRSPALSFASTDHHIIALRAFENARALGYKRPGLVLDQTIDDLVEGRFTAGYRIGQSALPDDQRLNPFYEVSAVAHDRAPFQAWYQREKPDVIFTLYNGVRTWLEEMGLAIPRDIGLIQLEWRHDRPEWAGMDQHNDLSGEAAVDMVISMIHGNENGVPPFPRATLISGSWVEGKTVRPQ